MTGRPSDRAALGLELAAIVLLCVAAAAAMAWTAGGFGWSWDALNHHVYLGYVAEQPRWDRDVVAASYQSYQHPYLYWPVYRLSLLTWPGVWVGALWSAAQAALTVPALWWLSRQLMPPLEPRALAVAARAAACAMGAASAIVLNAVDTTSNDLLASLPLLWALVLYDPDRGPGRAAAAGVLTGASAALKLSNAVLALPLLLVWAGWLLVARARAGSTVASTGTPLPVALLLPGIGAAIGFTFVYAPWGWQLWQATGNPFYPLAGAWFGAAPGP